MPILMTGRDGYRVPDDPLSAVMDDLRIRSLYIGGPFALAAPWSMAHRAKDPQLYIISGGNVALRIREGEADEMAVTLSPGDLVFILGGVRHLLSDSMETVHREDQLVPRQREPGTPNTSGFIGMECDLYGSPQSLLLNSLPKVICIKQSDAEPGTSIASTLAAFRTERTQRNPGHAAILKRLVEIALTQVVRAWIDLPGASPGWLRGLKDPQLARVLQAVSEHPERRWNLASLAAVAGMSRSSFADRFKGAVGRTPMTHVAQVRMNVAARMLDDSAASLKSVANAVGYDSIAAFRHHFRDQFGLLPREFRKRDAHGGNGGIEDSAE